MLIISHRGNVSGPNNNFENNPKHIQSLLDKNINCEIDVYCLDNKWYLGHDKPQHNVNFEFLIQEGLWCHAKNILAFHEMLNYKQINCFWHETDKYTLTSFGYIWSYYNMPLTDKCVIVDNNENWKNKNYCGFAVCTDYII